MQQACARLRSKVDTVAPGPHGAGLRWNLHCIQSSLDSFLSAQFYRNFRKDSGTRPARLASLTIDSAIP